jgi:hypothetical protein
LRKVGTKESAMLSILPLEDDFARKSALDKVINRKATFAEEMNSPNTDAQFSMGASID